MMLQALIAYAERENLGDPDFEKVDVEWVIPINAVGHLAANVIDLREKPRRSLRPFTEQKQLTDARRPRAHFLCDCLERALGYGKAGESPSARRLNSHKYFKQLLTDALTACPLEAVRVRLLLAFFENQPEVDRAIQQLATAKASPTSERATFFVDGFDLLDSVPLREYWKARRQSRPAAGGELRVCVATGKLGPSVSTTTEIKGVPGGHGAGTKLISFDKPAFSSYGLDKAENSAISLEADARLRAALEQLIERGLLVPEFVPPKHKDRQVVHLFWTRHPSSFDPTDLFKSANEADVRAILESPKNGAAIIGVADDDFYALSLAGYTTRIIVRDWLQTQLSVVIENLRRWFRDLTIIERDGVSRRSAFKLGLLLYGLVREAIGELPPQVPTQLLFAALRGFGDSGRPSPLPSTALCAALRRQQLEPDSDDPKRWPVITARLALIKACLLRSPNISTNNHQQPEPMTECLNPDSRDSAYLCGRLFAVFDRLQELGLPGVNAGVVQRYYASASTTPALVMGRLFRNAQFHLDKTEARWGGGAAENVRKNFEEITCALGDKFPPTLDLEGQGRFALGYYHQKADYRRRTAERKDAEAKAEAGK